MEMTWLSKFCHKHPERGPVKMVVIEFCPVCRGQHGGSKTLEKHGAAKMKRWGKKGGRPVLEKPS